MSSLKSKDRVSLCSFTFSDGRRCRTPRAARHPYFCFYHAQKEARARAIETLGKDLAYFFSGDYLSACDLSTALGRLIPAVLRGEVKPRAARTVAYLAQTLMQAIHISQNEYTNAFGSDAWRKSIRNSVNENHNYRFPPVPQPSPAPAPPTSSPVPQTPSTSASSNSPIAIPHSASPGPATEAMPSVAEKPALSSSSTSQPDQQPAPSLPTSLPPTSAEFARQVLVGHPAPDPAASHSELACPGRPACGGRRSEESASSSHSSPATVRLTPLESTLTRPPRKC